MQGTPAGPETTNTPTTKTAQKPILGQAEETFNLSVPSQSTGLKQIETKAASISLARGNNFDEGVTLWFDEVPKGVRIDPSNPVINHGDTEANISLQAADAITLGAFVIKLTGRPTKDADAKTELELTVVEK